MKSFLSERFCALLVDTIIISLIISFSGLAEFFSRRLASFSFLGRLWTITFELSCIMALLYFFIFDICCKGITPGKYLFRIRVIGQHGAALSVRKHLLRSMIKFISLSAFAIAVLFVLFRKKFPQDLVPPNKTVLY